MYDKIRSSYTSIPRLSKKNASSIWSLGNSRCCFRPLEYGVQATCAVWAILGMIWLAPLAVEFESASPRRNRLLALDVSKRSSH